MKHSNTLLMLALIAVVGVFTLDVYLPGMSAMAKEFNVSISEISLTFSLFSIVFAISQLFYGILSDRIGRKPVLISGLIMAALATYLCTIAKNYDSILVARVLQAMGISAFVVVNAIIRDLYTGSTAIQVRTLVTTVSGVSISIAPTIGGLLQDKYDWQGGFIASLVLIIVTLIYSTLFYSESNLNRTNDKIDIGSVIKAYIILYSDSRYVAHVLQSTLAFTVHFVFIILSANIFIELLGFTPLHFGYLMFIYGGVYFANGLIASYSTKHISSESLLKLGSVSIGIGGLLMLIISLLSPLNAWQILLPMTIMTFGITIIRATATTCALASLNNHAGQGAAGLNLIQFSISAIIAAGISNMTNQPELVLSLLAITCAITIICLNNTLLRLPQAGTLMKFNHQQKEI